MTPLPLAGLTILLVEDHYLIAKELTDMLQSCGAEVLGPVGKLPLSPDVEQAEINAALLDVNLRGDLVFPLADKLTWRGVPVALFTGYDHAVLPSPYCDYPCLDKPVEQPSLIEMILRMVATRDAVPA